MKSYELFEKTKQKSYFSQIHRYLFFLFLQNYTICKAGDKLTSEQARILKLFDHKQAKFKLNIISVWSREDGSFQMLREDFDEDSEKKGGKEDEGNDDENMDDDAEIVE